MLNIYKILQSSLPSKMIYLLFFLPKGISIINMNKHMLNLREKVKLISKQRLINYKNVQVDTNLRLTQKINLLKQFSMKTGTTIKKKDSTISANSTLNDTVFKNKNYYKPAQFRRNSSSKSKNIFDSTAKTQQRFLTEHNPQDDINNQTLWRQSSSTWRNTSHKFSFSRQSRFKQYKCSHLDIQQLQIPSTLNKKSCSFGKGNKIPIALITLKNAKITPSPDRYYTAQNLQEQKQKGKGKTFGIGWINYRKTYLDFRRDTYNQYFTIDNPSAIYDVRQQIGKHKKKFSIYGRLKMFNQLEAYSKKFIPGPVHKINDILTKKTRDLNERNFGFGNRIDLAKPLNDNPPPTAYNLKGFCEVDKN